MMEIGARKDTPIIGFLMSLAGGIVGMAFPFLLISRMLRWWHGEYFEELHHRFLAYAGTIVLILAIFVIVGALLIFLREEVVGGILVVTSSSVGFLLFQFDGLGSGRILRNRRRRSRYHQS